MARKTYKEKLLKDSDVKRWYRNLKDGSPTTAEERVRVLGRFCDLISDERGERWTPGRIVVQVREDVRARPDKNGETFEDIFDDFIHDELDAGKAPSYLANYKKTLTSWLNHNGLPFFDIRKIRIGDQKERPTLNDETIPTQKELRAILHRAKPRGRAIIAFMAFSGARPQVLGNAEGTEGLRLKDLPDFAVEGRKVVVKQTPALIRVRRELSKAGHEYLTFLPAEGAEMVRSYLQIRLDRGEALGPESAVIRVTPGYEKMGHGENSEGRGTPFIVARNITREVRETFGKEFQARPYVLRSYFDTMMLLAESREGLPRDFRQFWMGHVGDIEAVYTLQKRPTEELIEELRSGFAKAAPYLSTEAEAVIGVQEELKTEKAERAALKNRIKELEGELSIYRARYGNILEALRQASSWEDFQQKMAIEALLDEEESPREGEEE